MSGRKHQYEKRKQETELYHKKCVIILFENRNLMQLEYFAVIQYMRAYLFLRMGAECKYIAMDFSLC